MFSKITKYLIWQITQWTNVSKWLDLTGFRIFAQKAKLIQGKVPKIKMILYNLAYKIYPIRISFQELLNYAIVHIGVKYFRLFCSQLFPQDKKQSLKGINAEKLKVFLSSRWRSHSRYIHSKRQSKWSEEDIHVRAFVLILWVGVASTD